MFNTFTKYVLLLSIFLDVDFSEYKSLIRHVQAGVVIKIVEHADVIKEKENKRPATRRDVPAKPVDENGKYVGLYDPECVDTLIITPQKDSVEIEVDKKILKKGGTTCHWDVVGAEDCIPSLACKKFQLMEPAAAGGDDPCQEEYLEVTDGSQGYQKFCGANGPQELSNEKKLRDFYITLKMAEEGKFGDRKFQCTVTCHPSKVQGAAIADNSEPDVSDECNCGRKPNADRIVGGEDAKRGEFPWMAALVAQGTRKPFCGGSLINNRFVLTAAHCFKGPYMKAININILLNGHKLNLTDSKVAGGQGGSKALWTPEQLAEKDKLDNSYRFFVEKYFIHPLYVRQTNDFDVALIKLDKPVEWKTMKEVAPVCMPKPAMYLESKEGAKAIVAGWGLNDSSSTSTMSILQKLDVAVFTNDECKQFYDTRYTRRMLCAGYREGGKDSCKGDSGGPLIAEKSKQVWEQIGIVSFGEGCAEAEKPGVYINTRQVDQWIRYISNMEESTWCFG